MSLKDNRKLIWKPGHHALALLYRIDGRTHGAQTTGPSISIFGASDNKNTLVVTWAPCKSSNIGKTRKDFGGPWTFPDLPNIRAPSMQRTPQRGAHRATQWSAQWSAQWQGVRSVARSTKDRSVLDACTHAVHNAADYNIKRPTALLWHLPALTNVGVVFVGRSLRHRLRNCGRWLLQTRIRIRYSFRRARKTWQ